MTISLFLWLIPTLASLLLLLAVSHYAWAWERRHMLGEAVIALELASISFLVTMGYPWLLQVILFLMELWIALLAGRLLFGRLPAEFLRRSTHLNSVLALGILVVAIDVWLTRRLFGFMGISYG